MVFLPSPLRYAALLSVLCSCLALDGLILRYAFEGTYTDDAGRLPLTPSGMQAFVPGREVGSLAASFAPTAGVLPGSGSHLYSDVTALLPSGASPRTIAAWVRANQGDCGSRTIASWGVVSTTWWTGVSMRLNSCSRLVYEVFGPGFEVDVPFNDGQWHHVATTFDGTRARLYFDGARLPSAADDWSGSLATPTSSRLFVGHLNPTWVAFNYPATSTYAFSGAIDELRIYNRSLSPDEMMALVRPLSEDVRPRAFHARDAFSGGELAAPWSVGRLAPGFVGRTLSPQFSESIYPSGGFSGATIEAFHVDTAAGYYPYVWYDHSYNVESSYVAMVTPTEVPPFYVQMHPCSANQEFSLSLCPGLAAVSFTAPSSFSAVLSASWVWGNSRCWYDNRFTAWASLSTNGSDAPFPGWEAGCTVSRNNPVCTLNITVSLSAGDAIMFSVSDGGDGMSCDSALFNAVVYPMASPSGTSAPSVSQTAAASSTSTAATTETSTPTPSLSLSPTPGLSCPSSLFRSLLRTDLVGSPLTDAPLATPTEGACRIACCGVPGCDGYAFAFTELRWVAAASCVLLANVSATVSNNFAASGLRVGLTLSSPPVSPSPAGTPLPPGGWPLRGGSVTPTQTASTLALPSAIPPVLLAAGNVTLLIIAGVPVGYYGGAYSGDGGPATSAHLYFPTDVCAGADGSLFVADEYNHCVRHVSPSGRISTFAGGGVAGYLGDGGLAINARLMYPNALAVEASGSVLIADTYNNAIRRVSTISGIISTVAGTGIAGFSGDGGAAVSAQLCYPFGIAVSSAGIIFISDTYNHRIRRVLPGGIIDTIAGSGEQRRGGDGGPAVAGSLALPKGLIVGRDDHIFIAEFGSNVVRRISPSGVIDTFAGDGFAGGSGYGRFSGDNGPASSASFDRLNDVAVDAEGNVFVADMVNNRIRRISATSGQVTTFAGTGLEGDNGDGLSAAATNLYNPRSVSIDSDGRIIIVDSYHHTIRMGVLQARMHVSPSPSPYCMPSLFRFLPRMDLVGTLVGNALAPGALSLTPSLHACRQACCDAPICDGFSFAVGEHASSATGVASCFLYVNITQLVPSSVISSGIYESTL